ncbi:hypothetical protein CRI94_11420 [Longibacter salinarum]|uniref:Aerotolerance regulator BatC n=1 Tax=Longibacter salinarum TaxID=1850348 RepID=A0A2A8CX17_9BACT|nr:hypothetical protein [Longibacter salinarum]PEN13242.1 hypothetical protein CRI94_11420 [Longibacter salinarum]
MIRFSHTLGYCFVAIAVLLVMSAMLVVSSADAQRVGAQTEAERRAGDPYFHEAAQYYVAEQKQPALQAIEEGLSVAPNHPKLRALRNKIREQMGAQPRPNNKGPKDEESSQSGENEQEGSSQGQSEGGRSDAPSESSGDRSGAPPDGQNGPQGQNESEGESSSENEQARQRGEGGSENQDAAANRDGNGGDVDGDQAGRLSRAQAERILQALEGQEKQLLREVQKREARPRRVEKDW